MSAAILSSLMRLHEEGLPARKSKKKKVNKQEATAGSRLSFGGERHSHHASTEQERDSLPGLWLLTRIGPTENLDGISKGFNS